MGIKAEHKELKLILFLPPVGKRRRACGIRSVQTTSEHCRRQRRNCESHVRSSRPRFRRRRTK